MPTARINPHPMARRPNPAPGARWPLWLAGLLGLLLAFVLFAPASWLAASVARASQQHVLLAQAQGTWRDGSAQVVLAGGAQSRGAALAPGRLHWRIGLGGIWHGQVELVLRWPELAAAPLRLRAQLGVGGWSLRQLAASARDAATPAAQAFEETKDRSRVASTPLGGVRSRTSGGTQAWQAQLPADLLEGLGTPWNTLALQGRIGLSLRHASLESAAGRLRLNGEIRVDAADMSSRLSTVAPLGSYILRIHGDGANAGIDLSTRSGPLILAGHGVWNGQRLQFDGTARAGAGQEQALANLLSLLGQREGDHVRISL
ncbi:conserved hypothetical protein [Thiomonas sp. X19]|nr:conserved hypothetical protein [Thiomonas sp. X19]